jgi:phosphoglucosamine mutase
MGRLFGTDGIRGLANRELTAEKVFRMGQAAALVLARAYKRPRILMGMDTRLSSDMLSSALTAGLCSVGADVMNLGVMPTPAVATLVRKYGAAAGAMITASHNPFQDNGIKFFSGLGYKLPDETEYEIEELYGSVPEDKLPLGDGVGRVLPTVDGLSDYIEFLKMCVDNISLWGMRVALDCAHGATYLTAPKVFAQLGAMVHTIGDKPDGVNINDNCGSTYTKTLAEIIKQNPKEKGFDFDVGFAFDGDGDRCFAVDEKGNILDGDMIMSIIAVFLKERGLLSGNTVVATVMSNLGWVLAARNKGINLEQVQVGDRYVLERMKQGGFVLGGEQSGHIILLKHQTTGDGVLAALTLASIMAVTGKPLSELNNVMVKMPQVLINAPVANNVKDLMLVHPAIIAEIDAVSAKFENRGRVLVRPSGTEPLVRVMIEGENIEEIRAEAEKLAGFLESISKEVEI